MRTSRRPMIINNARYSLTAGESPAKVCPGPMAPNPGPMLPNDAMAADAAVTKSSPRPASTTTLANHNVR